MVTSTSRGTTAEAGHQQDVVEGDAGGDDFPVHEGVPGGGGKQASMPFQGQKGNVSARRSAGIAAPLRRTAENRGLGLRA